MVAKTVVKKEKVAKTTKEMLTTPKVTKKAAKVAKEVKTPKEPKVKKEHVPLVNSKTQQSLSNVEQENQLTIPTSRIKSYISRHHMNKQWDDLIDAVKEVKKTNGDAKTVLPEDMIAKINNIYTEKELNWEEEDKKWNELIETVTTAQTDKKPLKGLLSKEIRDMVEKYSETKEKTKKKKETDTVYDVTLNVFSIEKYKLVLHALSVEKYKFSEKAFTCVAIAINKMMEEVIEYSVHNISEKDHNTLTPKDIPWSELVDKTMSGLYFNTKYVYDILHSKAAPPAASTDEEYVEESKEEPKEEEESSTSIGFFHFIHKITSNLKTSNEAYANIKIGTKFMNVCNELIVNTIDRYITMVKVLLDVSHNKTINEKLFLAVTEIILRDNINSNDSDVELVMNYLKSKM